MSNVKLTVSLDYAEAQSLHSILETWIARFEAMNRYPGMQDDREYQTASEIRSNLFIAGVSW